MYEILRLGAIPIIAQIAASIALKILEGGLNNITAVRQAANEFYELRDLQEAEYHELALLLSRRTEYDEGTWFNILMNMKRWGMLQPENGSDVPPPDLTKITPSWMYWIGGAVGIVALIMLLKK